MTQPDLLSRYQRAQTLMQGIYSKDIAYNTTLYPHWIGDTDSFWYQQHSAQGHCFQRVDGASQTHTEAFDHQALARALSSASGETFAADQLPISELDLSAAPASVGFTAQGKRWQYSAAQDSCAELPSLPPNWALSPDGRKALFVREHNLWLQDIATGEERALTHDGEAFYRYASTPSVYGRQEFITLEALWTPNGSLPKCLILGTLPLPRPWWNTCPPTAACDPPSATPNDAWPLPATNRLSNTGF
jgi:dipeptidyl-peptidase-4